MQFNRLPRWLGLGTLGRLKSMQRPGIICLVVKRFQTNKGRNMKVLET